MDELTPPAKIGRPSIRTPAMVDSIVERLSQGTPLAEICRDKGMPHSNTVRDWMEGDPALSVAIARAREAGFDQIALDALKIADYGENDTYESERGGETVNHDVIARSKLRVDTRLKLLAKWDPKRYGDKVQLADAEGNVLPVPSFVVTPVLPLPKPSDE